MADCPTYCQATFESYTPLRLTIQKTGGTVYVYAQNNGRSIILIKRLLLCLGYPGGGTTVLYLRESDFAVAGERVEQYGTWLKYQLNAPGVDRAQAQAEYVEVTERCVSACHSL